MTGWLAAMKTPFDLLFRFPWTLLSAAALAGALLFAPLAIAESTAIARELQALTTEREMLATELEQYQRTLDILQRHDTPPEQSSNPAVRKLALEMVSIKERLIAVTEREVTLLQEQITTARQLAAAAPQTSEAPAASEAIESKPLRTYNHDYSVDTEAENVERLHKLLANYYAELQEAAQTLPSPEELAARAAAQIDADKLAKIPFSADKVRLNGAEGSTALTQITQRLTDPNIPESRRDIAPICGVKTRLFGNLIASENRSLKPVGKNHFITRLRLQPGDTTLRIKENRWKIRLPQNVSSAEFLVTLYTPPGGVVELHLFAIKDLLAEDDPHIPAWLPSDLDLKINAG
jgi:hypothetical protein